MGSDTPDLRTSFPRRGALLQAEAEHVTRRNGTFKVYVAVHGGGEHVVLVKGDVRDREGVLCRVSSACLMSTALLSAECDCKDQLAAAMNLISSDDRGGIVIYLVDQEGRGHGLKWKVRALANKNQGMDTFAAVEHLGLPEDVRDYSVVPAVLEELGVPSVALLTNNPVKRRMIEQAGVVVKETHALEVCPPEHAWRHMEAKRARGHALTNAYMRPGDGDALTDTAEIPRVGQWMPTVSAGADG
ncbi:MAG TPA: GTP cyclohydrolase II [Euzebyales bacterium]|nr:GTP cyclohydrolase II [Euzebyales bacterium]